MGRWGRLVVVVVVVVESYVDDQVELQSTKLQRESRRKEEEVRAMRSVSS